MKPCISLCFLLINSFAFAQKIENINQQAVGNKIIVTYDITDSKPDQTFDVALYCSHDSFSKVLVNVNGNGVGDNVGGGLNRTIIWSVLDELPQFVGDYNFEVRALVHEHKINTTTDVGTRNLIITDKDSAYPEISNTLTNYINEAKDLKDAFQFISSQAFESRQALNGLTQAVDQYNAAYEKLNNQRLTYEKLVTDYWKRDVLVLEFKSLMDYTLGDVHSVDILTLTQRIAVINNLYQGQIKSQRKINEAKLELTKNIQLDVTRLDKRLQELERRTNRMLYNLSQE